MTTDRTAADRVFEAWIDERLTPEDLAVAVAANTSDGLLIGVLAQRPESDPQMTPLEAEQILQRVTSSLARGRDTRRQRSWLASAAVIAALLFAVSTWSPKTRVRPITHPAPPHEPVLVKQVRFESTRGERRVYFRMQVYRTTEESNVRRTPS